MRGSSADTSTPFTSLPLVIDETSSRSSPLALTALLAPILIGLAVPFAMLGSAIITEPAARLAVAERPLAAAQVILASLALGVLVGWPLVRLLRSAAGRRTIRIAGGHVTVKDAHPFGRTSWTEALSSYTGLAHRVVTSLSGVRHELLLIHPDHRRTLLIWAAPRLAQEDVTEVAKLLNVAEISSREGSSHEPLRRRLGPSRPQPQFAVAALSPAE